MKSRYYPFVLLLATAVYFLVGQLGLSLAFLHANVSPVWPPTGLAIALVWWLGYRLSAAVFVGALVVNLFTDVPVAAAVGMAAGNTLEAVSAVFLLRRLILTRNPFYGGSDILRFVLVTFGVATPVSATLGNLSLCLTGSAAWSDFVQLWLTWWLGDGVGALVVAPLILVWVDRPPVWWTWREIREAVLLLALLIVVADIVFAGLFFPSLAGYPLEHLIMPFLLWAGFRFGPHGSSTSTAVLSGIAIWGTTRGFGPFASFGGHDSLILLQVFLATAGVTTAVLAAIVNERKRTEEALRTKETQLQLITDITPVMLTHCSRELRYRFVNRAYAATFNLPADQIVGQSVPDFMGPKAYKTVQPYIERVLEGKPVEFESEIPYLRASPRFMRVAYMPERDRRGNVTGWVASLTDITDRKRTEEQIRTLNAELQRRITEFVALIDTAPVGIAVAMDPACNYIWGNPEFLHMLGTDQANLSKSGPTRDKLPFKILRNGKEVPPADLPMQRACREGREALEEEMEIRRDDGTIVHELCRATPLLDEDGIVRGCIGVFLNITERKQAESDRERLLTREQDARADAEAASRVKDEFLAVVSHELRTPLNSILGWAQLLRGERLDAPTSARALESIERNAKAQAKLVDDLLDVSRIISGKLQLDVKPIDLISVVKAAIDSLRHALDAKEIRLETSMDPAAAQIYGDATRLQQVIWNLLSNSTKFTPKGGRIEIRLERQDTNARLSVTDTGEGIAPEFLPYVFDRFRQEDSSRTRKHGGLGLGLAIVHNLIELHGGTVEASSAGSDRGATFIITLPQVRETPDPSNVPPRPRLVPASPTLAGIRLLIVEDDADSLDMLRMLVRVHGAEAKTATTAAEGLQVFEQWFPAVLIVDIGLPDEDGYTFIQKAKALAQEKGRTVLAIALTGYAGEHEGQRALAAGFQMYLTKPTEPRRLVEVIANLVSRNERSAV